MEPRAVVERLKEFSQTRAGSDWDELDVETRTLIRGNPFAFLIAVAFDRGMLWQEAWRIPTEINRQGCLDPALLAPRVMTDAIIGRCFEGLAEGAPSVSQRSKAPGRLRSDARQR